jgi:hypothetical protein
VLYSHLHPVHSSPSSPQSLQTFSVFILSLSFSFFRQIFTATGGSAVYHYSYTLTADGISLTSRGTLSLPLVESYGLAHVSCFGGSDGGLTRHVIHYNETYGLPLTATSGTLTLAAADSLYSSGAYQTNGTYVSTDPTSNSTCVVEIHAPPGQRVGVTFRAHQASSPAGCAEGRVYSRGIPEGSDPSSLRHSLFFAPASACHGDLEFSSAGPVATVVLTRTGTCSAHIEASYWFKPAGVPSLFAAQDLPVFYA